MKTFCVLKIILQLLTHLSQMNALAKPKVPLVAAFVTTFFLSTTFHIIFSPSCLYICVCVYLGCKNINVLLMILFQQIFCLKRRLYQSVKDLKNRNMDLQCAKSVMNQSKISFNFFMYDFDYKSSYLHRKNSSTETVY